MSQNLVQGLIVRNTSGNPDNMEKLHETVKITLKGIKAMGEEVLDKMSPDELQAMINTKVLEAVAALNIDGLSVVPATEAGLDMMKDVKDEDRAKIREAIEEIQSMGTDEDMEDRRTAVNNVTLAMAQYAMTRVNAGKTSGAPELFYDFGQIAANSITEVGAGAKLMGSADAMVPEAIKLLNRVAFLSMVKMLLNCTKEQAASSSIDQDAIREDLKAAIDGKGEERMEEIVGILNDFATASNAKAGVGNVKLH